MSTLRILHFSDLHGRAFREASRLVERFEPDWIVLTGDMIPGHLLRREEVQARRQAAFWSARRHHFLRASVPTTYVRGNHEGGAFQDPALMRVVPCGLEGRVGFLEGIPREFGPWGFPRELDPEGLEHELEAEGHPDVLLSHVPPHGCLDRTRRGARVGHRPLAQRLARGDGAPALVLCGHVHESWGSARLGDTLVVNAAGGCALVEYAPSTRTSRLLEMHHLVHPLGGLARLWRGRSLPGWLWRRDSGA